LATEVPPNFITTTAMASNRLMPVPGGPVSIRESALQKDAASGCETRGPARQTLMTHLFSAAVLPGRRVNRNKASRH
jgi:hypothetical protein